MQNQKISRKLWPSKFLAFSIHLSISLLVALLAAALVFILWYPYPYREISGGRELFTLIMVVDVIIGPFITLVAFNPDKSRREKWLDFSVIGLTQFCALLYGLWTVAQARPVHMVFEYDRFRVVHAVDVDSELLKRAVPALRSLPWSGPTYLSLRPITANEQVDMTLAAISGMPLSARPELWQSYQAGRDAILTAAHPAEELLNRFPQHQAEIEHAVAATKQSIDTLAYLPLTARGAIFWTALLDRKNAEVLYYLPIDSF